MLSSAQKDRVLIDLLRTCYEATGFEEFGAQVLPSLEKLFDTSTSLLFRCDEQGRPIAIAGPLAECHRYYAENYYAVDPFHPLLRQLNPWFLHVPSLPEWKEFSRHPAHTYCASHYDFENFIHLRMNEGEMHAPGMVGMLLARAHTQPDFSPRERQTLLHLMPALIALAKRSGKSRLPEPLREALMDFGARPKLAFDAHGKLLWVSEGAARLLDSGGEKSSAPPEALQAAARRLGNLLKKEPSPGLPIPSLTLPRPDGLPLRADLHLTHASGDSFVIVELEEPGASPQIEQIRARHGLTRAEAQVLHLISLGLPDREIGKRLFVSRDTVHTHTGRVFSKLGVSSRVQAALLARGHWVETENEEDSSHFPKSGK